MGRPSGPSPRPAGCRLGVLKFWIQCFTCTQAFVTTDVPFNLLIVKWAFKFCHKILDLKTTLILTSIHYMYNEILNLGAVYTF